LRKQLGQLYGTEAKDLCADSEVHWEGAHPLCSLWAGKS